MKQAWLSDLHIGVRDHPADDFGSKAREEYFFKTLKKLNKEVDLIGLNGDIFELWRFDWEDIQESRSIILDAIDRYVDVFIRGNHDRALPDIVADTKVIDEYSLSSDIHVAHGHQYDTLNYGEWGFVGELGGKLGHWIQEYIYSDIDLLFYKLQELANDGHFGHNKDYFARIKEKNSVYEVEIIGHTHDIYTSKMQERLPFTFNTGAWVYNKVDILMLDYSRTNIKVSRL